METVWKLIYLGDRASGNGRCEVAVTVRTRYVWDKHGGYGELLYGWKFHLKLMLVLYVGYGRPAILYGSEAWCLQESQIGILQMTEGSIVRAICGVQLNDSKRYRDLMLFLGLNKTRSGKT